MSHSANTMSGVPDAPHPLQTQINRKVWKKVKGQQVWPPHVEAAFFRGMEAYIPDDSRETRLLGRHPLRNKFVSDYIFKQTGEYRSTKQVGSRLQQLKDTAEGRQFLKKISGASQVNPADGPHFITRTPTHYAEAAHRSVSPAQSDYFSSAGSSSSSARSPSPYDSPVAASSSSGDSENERAPTIIHITVLPENGRGAQTTSTSSLMAGSSTPTYSGTSMPSAVPLNNTYSNWPPSHPRRLRDIDSTITFTSATPIDAAAYCSVFKDQVCVHSDVTPLVPVQNPVPTVPNVLMYSVGLAPEYWQTLCQASDPSRYYIIQEIRHVRTPDGLEQMSASSSLVFSGIYYFRYPWSPTPSTMQNIPMDSNPVASPWDPVNDFFVFDSSDTTMHAESADRAQFQLPGTLLPASQGPYLSQNVYYNTPESVSSTSDFVERHSGTRHNSPTTFLSGPMTDYQGL